MRKNVAGQKIGAQMVSATDGSAFTDSVTIYVTGDAGTQAIGSVGAGACTHEGNGFHTYAPAQAETNYDHVAFTFIGTGAVPSTVQVFPNFPQTGDNFVRIGAPVAASISADIAAVQGDADNLQTRIPAALVGGRIDASIGAVAAGTIAAAAMATDMDGYTAKLWVFDDNGGSTDRYLVVWYKNGTPVVAGITSPAIQVIKSSDGTDLIASVAMTEIGALGLYKKDEATNRMVSGASYMAKATATIGGSTRIWFQPVGRDS